MDNLNVEKQKLAIANVVTDALNNIPVTIVELILISLLHQVEHIKENTLSEEYHKVQEEVLNKKEQSDDKEDEKDV